MQKAFSGPLDIRERIGAIDAETLASADLEAVFREKPAIHRYPGNMAKRVHELAVHIRDVYDGDASRVWTDAADADELRANIAELPGFGEMKVKALGSVLAKRFGVEAANELVPWHPTLGDVDSAEALARLPGRQARAQGRVVQGEGPGLGRQPSATLTSPIAASSAALTSVPCSSFACATRSATATTKSR